MSIEHHPFLIFGFFSPTVSCLLLLVYQSPHTLFVVAPWGGGGQFLLMLMLLHLSCEYGGVFEIQIVRFYWMAQFTLEASRWSRFNMWIFRSKYWFESYFHFNTSMISWGLIKGLVGTCHYNNISTTENAVMIVEPRLKELMVLWCGWWDKWSLRPSLLILWEKLLLRRSSLASIMTINW